MSNSQNIEDLLKANEKNKLHIGKTKSKKNEIKEEIKPKTSINMKQKKINNKKSNDKNKAIPKNTKITFDFINTTVEI